MDGRVYFGPTTQPFRSKPHPTEAINPKCQAPRANRQRKMLAAHELVFARFSITNIDIDQLTRIEIQIFGFLELENDRQDANVHALLSLV